jgi:hypothetical protein
MSINVLVNPWINRANDCVGINMLEPHYSRYNNLLNEYLRDIERGDADVDIFTALFTMGRHGANRDMANEVNDNFLDFGNKRGCVYGGNGTNGGGRMSIGDYSWSGRDLMTPWNMLAEEFGGPVVFWLGKVDGAWYGIRHDSPRETWRAFNSKIGEMGDTLLNHNARLDGLNTWASNSTLLPGVCVERNSDSAVFALETDILFVQLQAEIARQQRIEDSASSVDDWHGGVRGNRTRPSYATKSTEFTIGFEVEKEDDDVKHGINHVKFRKATGWDKERDGSLNDNGYEIVSPTYDLYDNRFDEDLRNDVLREHINAEYSRRCGGHIHLGAVGMRGTTFFDRIAPWLPLIYAVYVGRINGEHCKVKKNDSIKYSSDKYQSVRLFDDHIELRIPSAVSDVENLIWRRDLLRIICDNLDATPLRIVGMLTDKRSKLHKHMSKVYSEARMLEKFRLYVYFANELLDDAYTTIPERIPQWENLFNKSQISHLRNEGFRQKSNVII